MTLRRDQRVAKRRLQLRHSPPLQPAAKIFMKWSSVKRMLPGKSRNLAGGHAPCLLLIFSAALSKRGGINRLWIERGEGAAPLEGAEPWITCC
jgi:hypothetical protein